MCAKKIKFSEHPTLPFDDEEEYTDLGIDEIDKEIDNLPERNLYYISFGSGSSGNSCYIGTKKGGIIVDAGVKTEDVVKTLSSYGVPMSAVKGLLLTHDHYDHVHFAYNILRSYKHIRLFCTNRVLTGLLRRHSISKRIKEYHNPIFKEIPFKVLDFEITAFEVPHDGTDNVGFSIEFDSRRFVLATDLGAVTDRAHHYMSQANYLVIESNYDKPMLIAGRYPEYLKARIQTQNGHMDNEMTAQFLKDVYNRELKYIFLCHLSKDNNTPAKALKSAREALESKGVTVGNAEETITDRKAHVQLMALPRYDASRWFILRPFKD